MPAGPDHAHQPRAALAVRGLEQVLELAQLLVPADERRLQRVAAVLAHPAGRRRARRATPGRVLLALERLLARVLEHDGARLARTRGRLTDEHRARQRRRLEPRGGVDDVARDHALVGGADRDGSLAGQDTGPRLDAGAQRADRIHQLQARPDGALGVVLVGDRGAPDGHHRVADELLDGAAVLAR